jgi:hypothetical protein
MMEGPCADSEEKHEPVSDIHTVAVDSLIALDPERPIREADIAFAELPRRQLRSSTRRIVGGLFLGQSFDVSYQDDWRREPSARLPRNF